MVYLVPFNLIVNKTWGTEEWIVNNDHYCGKILTCVSGLWSSQGLYHYHKNKDETFYILNGSILLDVEGKEFILKEGDSMRIHPNRKHRFKAISDTCKIMEFSTHHDESDSYRLSL